MAYHLGHLMSVISEPKTKRMSYCIYILTRRMWHISRQVTTKVSSSISRTRLNRLAFQINWRSHIFTSLPHPTNTVHQKSPLIKESMPALASAAIRLHSDNRLQECEPSARITFTNNTISVRHQHISRISAFVITITFCKRECRLIQKTSASNNSQSLKG